METHFLRYAGIISGSFRLCVHPLKAEAASGKITLTKTKMTLYAGESTKVTVKKVTYLKNSKVKFSSSNKKVATVSSKGLVTAKKNKAWQR